MSALPPWMKLFCECGPVVLGWIGLRSNLRASVVGGLVYQNTNYESSVTTATSEDLLGVMLLGTLNYVKPADRLNAAALVKKGKSFSLGLNFDQNGPQRTGWGGRCADLLEAVQPGAVILVTTKVNDSAAAIAPARWFGLFAITPSGRPSTRTSAVIIPWPKSRRSSSSESSF